MNPVNMLVQIIRGAVPAMMCTLVGLAAFGISILPLAWALGVEGVAVASLLYFLVAILAGGWLIHSDPAKRQTSSKVPR
jgi:O-antigen/teichoic acid export membrane protein